MNWVSSDTVEMFCPFCLLAELDSALFNSSLSCTLSLSIEGPQEASGL